MIGEVIFLSLIRLFTAQGVAPTNLLVLEHAGNWYIYKQRTLFLFLRHPSALVQR